MNTSTNSLNKFFNEKEDGSLHFIMMLPSKYELEKSSIEDIIDFVDALKNENNFIGFHAGGSLNIFFKELSFELLKRLDKQSK